MGYSHGSSDRIRENNLRARLFLNSLLLKIICLLMECKDMVLVTGLNSKQLLIMKYHYEE